MSHSGIHLLKIPTPFPVGDVNCYLIADRPLTLVDTGPNLAGALDALESALAVHGVAVKELELIVLTHQHNDHIGLTDVLQRRSGAQVAAFAPLAPWLGEFPASAADDDAWAQTVMLRHGLPQDLAAAFASSSLLARALGSGGEVAVELSDGQRLEFAERSLQVLQRPGHSPSDIMLWDEERALALGGDHLMASISSNAIMTRPLGGAMDAPRPRSLLDYLSSLRATHALAQHTVILPGHGPPVSGHRELISERVRLHERRARKVLRTLSDGPRSAHQIAVAMWGRMAITQAPLMMSEVLGHLDLLIADGSVVEDDSGPVVQFRAV